MDIEETKQSEVNDFLGLSDNDDSDDDGDRDTSSTNSSDASAVSAVVVVEAVNSNSQQSEQILISNHNKNNNNNKNNIGNRNMHVARKLWIENNIICGLDSNESNETLCNLFEYVSNECRSRIGKKTTFVVIYDIDPIVEYCDLIDLISDLVIDENGSKAQLQCLNYYPSNRGRCWMKFETHAIACKTKEMLHKFYFYDRHLMAGLIEMKPKLIPISKIFIEYKNAQNIAYPAKPKGFWRNQNQGNKYKNKKSSESNSDSNPNPKKKKNKNKRPKSALRYHQRIKT